MEARRDIEFIPDRLNEEPVVFLSMTNSEIKLSLMIFFAIWTPLCLLVGLLVGKVLLSLACVAGMVFASMWLAGKRLRTIKRGKPKQYHMLALQAWLQDKGLTKQVLIRESRTWDIQRWRTGQSRRMT
jgi:conjugative transfer region protein (TIGR03750 family)